MGCTPSMVSTENNNQNRKDSTAYGVVGSGGGGGGGGSAGGGGGTSTARSLFCVNIGRSTSHDGHHTHNNANDIGDAQSMICSQALIDPYQKDIDIDSDKQCLSKKDSIVSVAGFGHLTGFSAVQTVVRRAAASATTSATNRLGHRKSSLALTPEEEPWETSSKPSTDLKYPNLLPPKPLLRALLIFNKSDQVCDALTAACHRLEVETTVSKTLDGAFCEFQHPSKGAHNIVICDARNSKYIDAESLGSTIRGSKGGQYTTVIAIVKKILIDKDDAALLSLLNVGFNKCVIESPQISLCTAELRQILHSIVRPQNVISTQQALYTALHRLKEAIIITDDTLRIQYANRATERLFNMRLDEIASRPLDQVMSADMTTIQKNISRNREYDTMITIKRKTLEPMNVHLKAAPITCIGRLPTHCVLTFDLPSSSTDALACLPQPTPNAREAPRGSLHSIRRGSFDVRSVTSDGLRRTSIAKLSSLPLEAPITKVVAILTQLQENFSPEDARLLDQVLDVLKREGLYSPQMKEMKTDDPVATDLIGALLAQGPTASTSSRRSSNDSVVRNAIRVTAATTFTPMKVKGATQIIDLLQYSMEWDFNIFQLEQITEKRPLIYLGLELFRRFDVYNTFNCDETIFKNWLFVIEANYRDSNSYHNSTHAADVMQAIAVFLRQLQVKDSKILDAMDEATSLIAAATHDIDHPGRSSAFLCNSNHELALLYNDLCVLESHHSALTFRLTLKDEKTNIFQNLDRDTYKHARSIVVDMILATEMTRHFEHLAKFVSIFGNDADIKEIYGTEGDDNQILIRRMMIKCADVSNPARPLRFCVEWARRIAEEYFMQTDEEKRLNLPIVMPMFDRATCSISKSQIGFIEYIIQDMMHAWDGFIDMPELIQFMQHNYGQWKAFEGQGIHTLNDIQTKQDSINRGA